MHSTTNKKAGFTLIELLTAVSVIALLSSIVLVSFRGATQKARIAKGKTFAANIQSAIGIELVGAWNFDEGAGTTAVDASGNNLTGQMAGHAPVWRTDDYCISRSCLEFDGVTNAYADIPDTNYLPLFTLTAWVYNVSGGDGRHSILRDFWEVVGTQLCFWSYDFANDYWRCTATNIVPYDSWTHVATTWDGTRIRHYANGIPVWKDTAASSGTSQRFTSIAGYPGRIFKGRLDEIRIYAESVTAANIKDQYLAGLKRLLASGMITKDEYERRIDELNSKYALTRQ